jgi:hypothetical protein
VVKRPSKWVWVKADREPPPMPTGFQLLRRRWVVERTFGWLGRWRRLSKDDEYLPATAECDIYLAMIRVMLRRLAECSTGRLLRCPLKPVMERSPEPSSRIVLPLRWRAAPETSATRGGWVGH